MTHTRFTRDQVLKRAAVLGVASAAMPVAALGKDSVQSELEESQQKPRYGGTLRMSQKLAVTNISPEGWGEDLWLASLALYNRLVSLSSDGKTVQPDLAEALPDITRNGRRYVFRLRRGVHHGREMTANDVKFTFEYIIHPKNKQAAQYLYAAIPFVGNKAYLDGSVANISGFKVLNKYTIQIDLVQPDSSFLYAATLPMAGIIPREVVLRLGDKFRQQPSGTGPFRVKSFNPGSSLQLVRNPKYFKKGVPYLNAVNIEYGVDPTLALLRIQRGELDLSQDFIPPGQLAPLQANPKTRRLISAGAYSDCRYLAVGVKNPDLAKVRVRQAVASAIDRAKIVRILNGYGEVAKGGIFSPLSPYWQENFPTYQYNPARARTLLSQAGYPNGLKLDGFGIVSYSFEPDKTIGESIQADLKAVGIDSGLHLTLSSRDKIDPGNALVVSTWELPYPHGSYVVDAAWTTAAIASGCCNYSHFSSARIDALALEGHRVTKPAAIASVYERIDREMAGSRLIWIPLYYPRTAFLRGAKLRGFTVPGTPGGNTKFLDRYWLAA